MVTKSKKKSNTTKPKVAKKCECNSSKSCNSCSCGGFIYFLGFIGTVAYYITTTEGFWIGVWGVIKALVWPAILVFKIFQYIN